MNEIVSRIVDAACEYSGCQRVELRRARKSPAIVHQTRLIIWWAAREHPRLRPMSRRWLAVELGMSPTWGNAWAEKTSLNAWVQRGIETVKEQIDE